MMMKQTNAFQRFLALCGGLMVVVSLLTGCYSPPTETGNRSGTGPAVRNDHGGASDIPVAYTTLRPGELVKIDFSGPPSPPEKHEENIKDDGTITLYLIGPLKAAGKTPGQLQAEIHALYVPRYYKHLNVTLKTADRFFTVGGAVIRPDRQLYLGPITVTGAIQACGDFNDYANKRKVRLTRADGTTQTINVEKALKDRSLDLPVFPGDTIYVPERGF